MRSIYLVLILIFSIAKFYSQTQQFCATSEVLQKWLNDHPETKADFIKRQQGAKTQDSIAYQNGYQNKISTATVYTIPVVFHVLYYGNLGLIDDSQIIDELNILNLTYRKLNPDTINIYPPFLPADVGFEFRLATKDPVGNCTNGITRHYDSHASWMSNQVYIDYFKYTWDPTKYLNVYVVDNINYANAYAMFPGQGVGFNDVIVIEGKYTGSIGTSNVNRSKTLTHEIGHWFNLDHVWGSGAIGITCGDDGVSDTPITKGFSICPSSTVAVCNPTISENFQNYMEYSSCRFMFTQGQVNRMVNAITSTVSGRNNLWSNSNLVATGVLSPNGICPPIPSFYATFGTKSEVDTVCAGQGLIFTDASYNAIIAGWQWSAGSGANISSPTSSITTITFNSVGATTVNLAVSSSAGTSSLTKTIVALDATPNVAASYQESFEAAGLPVNFSIINPDADVTWQQTSLAAATGSSSYYIEGIVDAPNSSPDILETPSYDFLNNQGATFTFKYAYAKRNTSNADVFKIQVSSNCGGVWTDMSIGSNAVLSSGSGGVTTVPLIPTPAQFKLYDITTHPAFTPFSNESNVRFRFFFQEDAVNGYGNNFFLDDINFSAPSGINELTRSIKFNLSPNPSSGEMNIKFTLSDDSHISYYLTDAVGRILELKKEFDLSPGDYLYKINEFQKLNSGIYFLNFDLDGLRISRKLIIQ
jgi:hypothetical protein